LRLPLWEPYFVGEGLDLLDNITFVKQKFAMQLFLIKPGIINVLA